MFALSLVVTLLVVATCGWYLKRRRLPPGPPALPLLGSLPFLHLRRGLLDWSEDTRLTRHRLATVSLGPKDVFVINDLKLAKELFDKDEFNKRAITEWVEVFKIRKGKLRGILATEGGDWVKQRRFGLRTLRDLGFGRRTIEEIVNKEIDEIISKLASSLGQTSTFPSSTSCGSWWPATGLRRGTGGAGKSSATSRRSSGASPSSPHFLWDSLNYLENHFSKKISRLSQIRQTIY